MTSRSQLMSRIRGTDTSPERVLRAALWRNGLRYRLHAATPAGRPDVVFPSRRVAVFIDGCFWHGCTKHYVRPRSNEPFWTKKLRENVERDQRQTAELESLGWRVIRVWEHEVFEELSEVVESVERALQDSEWAPQPSWRVLAAEPIDEAGSEERRVVVDLRDPQLRKVVQQARTTTKWKIPAQLPLMAAERRRTSRSPRRRVNRKGS